MASRSTRNLDALKRFVAYIPQDDAFDDHLTIEENLRIRRGDSLAASLRARSLAAHRRAS